MNQFITKDQLLSLLHHTFGAKVKITRQKIVSRQHDYLVLYLELHYPPVNIMIKLSGPEASTSGSFARAATLYRMVSTRTSIPVPEILGVNTDLEAWPWRYLISIYIQGQEWVAVRELMNQCELANAYRTLGNAVAQIHQIRFQSFGEFVDDGTVSGGDCYIDALIRHARHIIKSGTLADLFCSAIDKQKDLFQANLPASLCHEDLHGHNILFTYQQGIWSLASFLDFDKAWAGQQETDLARLEFWKAMTSKEFWKAYEEIQPIDPLYEQRRPFYQVLWCFEFARSTSQHLADTQALCAQLGLPWNGRFE